MINRPTPSAALALLLVVTACAPPPVRTSYTPSSSYTPPAARPAAPSKPVPTVAAVNATPQQIAMYERAVADQMRDPESARFRGSRVVRNSEGELGLCGEVNAKNAYGGYVGFDLYYAAIFVVPKQPKAIAVLWSSKSVGLDTILSKCKVA